MPGLDTCDLPKIRFLQLPRPLFSVSVLDRDELGDKTVEAANRLLRLSLSQKSAGYRAVLRNPLRGDDPFADFFGGTPFSTCSCRSTGKTGTQKQEVGGGTAFCEQRRLTDDKQSVVDDSQAEYTVLLNDKEIASQSGGTDPSNDIALLKVDGSSRIPTLYFQQMSDLARLWCHRQCTGEFRNTVSTGVVSGLNRRPAIWLTALNPSV